MMNNLHPIRDYIVPGKRAHLVGIGGVSMCPLAEVLAGKGLLVQGSDMMESDSVKHLRSKGISVAIGHNAENLGDCDFVIRTAAVHDGNPEIAGAIARGIPVYERAQAWGALMRKYPNALRGRYPRQNHHHLHVHPHFYGGGAGPHRDDRRHIAPAPLRLPGGPR